MSSRREDPDPLPRSAGDVHDFENVVVQTTNGVPVRVRDVASVVEGARPRLGIVGKDRDDDVVEGIVQMAAPGVMAGAAPAPRPGLPGKAAKETAEGRARDDRLLHYARTPSAMVARSRATPHARVGRFSGSYLRAIVDKTLG
jgi:hypothetical protein